MFEFVLRWFAWGFDASLKAALIAIIVATVLKLLRASDSNIRHRAWAGVLSGMLVLPLLTPLLPALRLPLLPSPEWLVAWTNQPEAAPPVSTPITSAPTADFAQPAEPRAPQPNISTFKPTFRPTDFPPASFPRAAAAPPPSLTSSEPLSPEIQLSFAAPAPPPAAPRSLISRRALAVSLVLAIGSIWLAIATILALRLSLAVWITARLRRSSAAIELASLRGKNTTAKLRECPLIRVPLTVGWLDPHILLPPDWRTWSSDKLHAVLAHEQMHVQRADCLVALLAELNCCVYWFHPLAWWLKQQLSSLAEQACDDAAILVLGSSVLDSSDSPSDRARYARHLLEVAAAVSQHHSRLSPLGVSMARRSNVETRILAILDFTRPLSQRLTWTKTLALLALLIPLITLAAALQPSSRSLLPEGTSTNDAATAEDKPAADKPATENPADPPTPKQPPKITGSILNTQGQPIAGVSIYIVPQFSWLESSKKQSPRLVTKSDDAGRFEFTPEAEEVAKSSGAKLLIVAPNYGPEFLPLSEAAEQHNITITLANDDKPIRGRILTLEGQPVADAQITVNYIRALKSGDLQPYIDIVKAGNGGNFNFDQSLHEPPHIEPITTDANGRFQLTGIGSNRVAELKVVSRTVQHALLNVMTVESEPLRPREGRGFSDLEKNRPPVFGATFDWVAKPARIITGTVVDAKTRQPIAGAGITSLGEGHAKTDENGRFELLGCAKAKSYGLLLNAVNTQYIGGSARIADTPGFEPIEVTLELTRGTTVKGRIIDQATQQPIDHARLTYFPLSPNDRVVRGIGSAEARASGAFTQSFSDTNGEFSIAVLPGPGFLGISAPNRSAFQPAVVDAVAFYKKENVAYGVDAPKGFPKNSLMTAHGDGGTGSMPADQYNFVELLNAPEQPELKLTHDIALVAAKDLAGVVLGPNGQPLTGAVVYGLANDYLRDAQTLRTSDFTVTRLAANEKRTLIFRHDAQKLAAQLEISADSQQSVRVTLQPWGEVTGHLLDNDGTPLANLELLHGGEPKAGETYGRLPGHVATDDQGRFRLTGLVPGLVYRLTAYRVATPSQIRIRIKPGEHHDLGDIKEAHEHLSLNASMPQEESDPTPARRASEGKADSTSQPPNTAAKSPPPPPPPLPPAEARAEGMPAKKSQTPSAVPATPATPTIIGRALNSALDWLEKQGPQPRSIRGRVIDLDGRPIAGATLEVPELESVPDRWLTGAPSKSNPKGKTDAQGRFALQLSADEVQDGWGMKVSAPGFAFASLDPSEKEGEDMGDVVLHPERPLAGRLIDSEGRPITGAKVVVQTVMAPKEGRTLDPFLTAWKRDSNEAQSQNLTLLPALGELVPAATTDEAGRFLLSGLPAEHIAVVDFTAPDFATFTLFLINRAKLDAASYNDAVPVFRRRHERKLAGPDSIHICLPDFKLSGRVTTDDGQPIAGVEISAMLGYWPKERIKSDTEGRYKIGGLPRGIDCLISFRPSNDLFTSSRGLLSRTIGVEAKTDEATKTLDIVLKRGITVRGRVTDPLTGEGVRGGVRFVPLHDNEYASQPGYDAFRRDRTMRHINADGTFSFQVIPGPGAIMMQVFNQGVTIDDEEFSIYRIARFSDEDRPHIKFTDNDERQFLSTGNSIESLGEIQNFVKRVDFSPGSDPQTLDMRLDRGQTVDLEFADAGGQPVENVFVSGITEQWPIAAPFTAPRCTIYALGANQPRRVLVLQADRNLAGSVTLTGEEKSPLRVTLKNAATFHGRAVDETGEPLANVNINVSFEYLSASELYRFHKLQPADLTTDAEGRFTMQNVLPNEDFFINIQINGKYLRPKQTGAQPNGPKKLQPGENRNLGTITFVSSN